MPAETTDLSPLLAQIRITNALLAAQLKRQVPQNEIVELLHATGATNADIAAVLGTSEGTVRTTVNRIRKKASE